MAKAESVQQNWIGKRVVITAGGTGGHVFPALAVASELRDLGCEVDWMGTKQGIESQLVPREGYQLHYIKVAGIRGKGLLVKVRGLFSALSAIWQSYWCLRKLQPIGVLGLGGYVTGPVGVAAKLLGIPLVIHEQNAVSGLTNRFLAKVSKRVLAAFPDAFPKCSDDLFKCVGNPLRHSITRIDSPRQRNSSGNRSDQTVRLLVVGGSLGALAINEVMPETVKQLAEELESAGIGIDLWHQCGAKTIEATYSSYGKLAQRYKIEAFIDNMAAAYEWADIIICRAGALTVSEVAAVGIAAIFIPYPYAVDDHQTVNAHFLVDQGAALLLPQSELTPEQLVKLLKPMILDQEMRLDMAERGRAIAKLDAANEVAQQLLEVSI